MLIIIAATMIALALTCIVLLKSHKADPAQLTELRPSLPILGVQIICGDCSGDDERPVKTYLDRFGNCARCGGQSHVLASSRAVYAQQLRHARMAEYESASGKGRIIPFEVPLPRAARAEKIA